MKKVKYKFKKAFGLLEMVLASSIFVLLLFSVVGLLLYGRDNLQKDNLVSRATLVASEGISAVESIRSDDFNNLVDGVYGLSFNGNWSLYEDFDEVDDFKRRVTISSLSEKEKKVAVEVTWFKSFSKLGRVLLTKHFLNLEKEEEVDNEDWWNNDWACRQELIIDNSSGASVMNNYQVLLKFNTAELISDGRMQADCSDLRFIDSNNETILNFYIEEGTCNSDKTRIWLKVPFIPSFNSKSVYIYYNNEASDTASSLENTFIDEINGDSPLILDLPLNEGLGIEAFDYSGLANNADINNASWVNGKFDNALEFNGLNSHLGIANSASLNPSEITIAAWVKWQTDPSTGNNWASIVNKNVDSQYRLHHNRLNTAFEFAIRTNNGGRWVISETEPVEGIWYFVVGTYDGSELKIYIDGELEGTTSHSGPINSSNTWLAIGQRTSGDRQFEGLIDKVQIYNKALGDEEINLLYNNYGQAILNYPGKTLIRKHYPENLEFSFLAESCLAGESDFDYEIDIYDDWSDGYCANITITTEKEEPVIWEIELLLDEAPLNGIPNNVWEANWSYIHPSLFLSGMSYNETVVKDEPVIIGFCASREDENGDNGEIPVLEADYELVIDSQWGSGYCASVFITTSSADLIEWFVNIEITGTPTSVWEADWDFNNGILSASGLSYNKYIDNSSPTSFGFCASLPPPMANFLTIDETNASVSGFQNRTVSDIYLSNNGAFDIEIESILVSWTGNPPSRLRNVEINDNEIFSGNVSSGELAILDENFTIVSGLDPYNLSLIFQHSFSGRVISNLTFNFSDGSSLSVSDIAL